MYVDIHCILLCFFYHFIYITLSYLSYGLAKKAFIDIIVNDIPVYFY